MFLIWQYEVILWIIFWPLYSEQWVWVIEITFLSGYCYLKRKCVQYFIKLCPMIVLFLSSLIALLFKIFKCMLYWNKMSFCLVFMFRLKQQLIRQFLLIAEHDPVNGSYKMFLVCLRSPNVMSLHVTVHEKWEVQT